MLTTIQRVVIFTLTLIVLKARCQSDHPCARTCDGGETMECEYDFTVEYYHTMSKACYACPLTESDCEREDCVAADGRSRSIMTVNRQIPGPSIEVCLGDTLVINVANSLISDSLTLHWHGQHQVGTGYMDGVPFITQCPIHPGDTFTYRFTATQSGTHFWHSHSGLQRGDGLFGAFIVREPEEADPHQDLYDYDLSSHVMVIHDWHDKSSLETFLAHYHAGGGNQPTNILVNGKGSYEEFTADDGTTVYTPLERFYVDQGFRYRFRIINNGILNCPIEMSVDGHSLTVISTDGSDVEALEVESLVSTTGERFDVIINANQTEGLYWIRFKGLIDCGAYSVHQAAVLHYSGSSETDYPDGTPTYEDAHKDGLQINSIFVGMETTSDTLSVGYLSSLEDIDEDLTGTPDLKYIAALSIRGLDNPLFHKADVYGYNDVDSDMRSVTPQINSVTLSLLPFPLLSQRGELDENSFCNESTVSTSCDEEHCSCPYVLQAPLNSLVEVIFVDTVSVTNHPMHLHGTSFRVIGMEYLGGTVTSDTIAELDENDLLIRNFENPPIKDTVQVPGAGYTIVRFIASNPGYWFMHCHLELHTALAMGLVFKFGEDEDMTPVPANFPQCGNYDIAAQKYKTKRWNY